MMKISSYIFLIFLLLIGCKEIYEPDTDFLEGVIVVNALLTDVPGSQFVQLSVTSKEGYTPLHGATVYVMDNEDNMTIFTESWWGIGGVYFSHGLFAAEYGKSYTLHIMTQDGKEYESRPQTMLPPVNIDSLYGEKVFKDYLTPTSSGGYIKQSMEGLDVFGDFENTTDETPKFRLNVTLLLLYEYTITTTSEVRFFCWKKINMVDILNINTPRFDIGSDGIRKHSISFLPVKKNFYNLGEEEYFHRFILIVRQYRLNNESYEFYKGVKEQLSADGKLFDPIAAQLKGNIRCISNPKDLALGLFEVSSTRSESFRLNSSIDSRNTFYSFTKIPDLESVSRSGCVEDVYPYFWLY